jgi:hypothetical protein
LRPLATVEQQELARLARAGSERADRVQRAQVLHPWLRTELTAILADLPAVRRWETWRDAALPRRRSRPSG